MNTLLKRYNEFVYIINKIAEYRKTCDEKITKVSFHGSILNIGKIKKHLDHQVVLINSLYFNINQTGGEKELLWQARILANSNLLGNDLHLYCYKCKSKNINKSELFLPECSICKSRETIIFESDENIKKGIN